MGRGWKRARKLRTAPVPYPTTVLQGPEAGSEDQDLRRHQRKGGADADLDGADCHAGSEISANEEHLRLESVQSDRPAAATTVRASRPVDLAERPLAGSAASGAGRATGARPVSWTAYRSVRQDLPRNARISDRNLDSRRAGRVTPRPSVTNGQVSVRRPMPRLSPMNAIEPRDGSA